MSGISTMRVKDYNACVEKVSDGLYRFALRLTNDTVVSQDLVQEAFTRLWVKRKEVERDGAKSYLFTTVYHAAIDLKRRAREIVEATENTAVYEPTHHDVQEVLNNGLALLPETQRTVILLRDYEGYSYKEIGVIAGLSEAQVKVYIHRARLFLREYIGNPNNLL